LGQTDSKPEDLLKINATGENPPQVLVTGNNEQLYSALHVNIIDNTPIPKINTVSYEIDLQMFGLSNGEDEKDVG